MERLRKFFAMLLIAAAVGAAAREPYDWANFGRYRQSNVEARSLPASERRVVFLGNSITDFWPKTNPAFFQENGFIGRGISGQTSYQFLARFREDVINLHPQIVVINAATNDIAENTHPYDEDITVGNILSLIELAQANGITPVLTSTLPAAAFGWRPEITDAADKIEALNKRLKAIAQERGLAYVDYYSSLVDADDPARPLDPRYSSDGVHPNAAGYAVMEALILPFLQRSLLP